MLLLLLLSRFSRVPIDGSPPDSSVPGILQARILEWVAISFSSACLHAKLLQSSLTVRPCGQQPTRLLHPQDSLGKNTGVDCHTTWMNLKDTKLKKPHIVIPFTWNVQNRQIYRCRLYVSGQHKMWGDNGYGMSFKVIHMPNTPIIVMVMVEQLCEYNKIQWTVHLKRINSTTLKWWNISEF